MNCKVMGILIFIVACGTVVSATFSSRVDCRKFVFAPSCRGVAAKRSSAIIVDDIFRKVVKSLITAVEIWGREQTGLKSRREELIRGFLCEKVIHALKIMLAIKKDPTATQYDDKQMVAKALHALIRF